MKLVEECSVSDAVKAMRIGEKMALAFSHDDKGNQSAELAQSVFPLGFGYRIIRLQNNLPKSKAVRRPLKLHFHGGLIKNSATHQTTIHKYLLKVLRGFNRLLVVVGIRHENIKHSTQSSIKL